jgi:hypothetical protein
MTTPTRYRAAVADDFRAATAVFKGEVVAVNAYDVTFRVERVWKGPAGQSISLGTGSSPEVGGLVRTDTCQSFQAKPGARFIVFADGDDEPYRLWTKHACGLTSHAEGAELLEQALERIRKGRPPAVDVSARASPLRNIFSAVMETVDETGDARWASGIHLAAPHRSALAAALTSELETAKPAGPYRVRPNEAVVEWVSGSKSRVEVLLSLGPVPMVRRRGCGLAMLVPLVPTAGSWAVVEEEVLLGCANPGPAIEVSSRPNDPLFEILGLALSRFIPEDDAVIVADAGLTTVARDVLYRLGPLVDATTVATREYVIPPGHLKVQRLEFQDGVATFEATLGPVPVARPGMSSGCGTGYRLKMRRSSSGWLVLSMTTTMC